MICVITVGLSLYAPFGYKMNIIYSHTQKNLYLTSSMDSQFSNLKLASGHHHSYYWYFLGQHKCTIEYYKICGAVSFGSWPPGVHLLVLGFLGEGRNTRLQPLWVMVSGSLTSGAASALGTTKAAGMELDSMVLESLCTYWFSPDFP